MAELRPLLQEATFLDTVRAMMDEGYQMAYLEAADNHVVAVAGFRIYTNLFMGKHLYVDDLVTASNVRSQGYGEKMVQWLRSYGKAADCNVLHLDSGTHRGQAHKFYFQQGFSIASYHFSESLVD